MASTFTHVGARGSVGNYRVTADAIRKPGKRHALNRDGRGYKALCGEFVHEESDDEFVGRNPVVEAGRAKVTCKRCLKAVAKG